MSTPSAVRLDILELLDAIDRLKAVHRASASLIVAAAIVLTDGVPINDNCRVCWESMPAWMCYLIGCWW